MIGVVAPGSQRSVVAEFFELFKTPWEWVQPGRSYEVMLCATDELPPNPAQLVLIFFARAHWARLIGAAFPATFRTSSIVNLVGSLARNLSAFAGPLLRGFALRATVFLLAGRPRFDDFPTLRGLPGPPVPKRSSLKVRSSVMSFSS